MHNQINRLISEANNDIQENTQKPTINVMDSVRKQLSNMESQFSYVLPAHITPKQFIRTVMTTVQQNQDLLRYDRMSLLAACMKAAEDGLLVDGKEACIVPYKGKLSYSAMKQGLINKAIRSGKLSGFSAHVVYENDHFECVLGDEERIVHSRDYRKYEDRGNPIAYYAIAKLKDGSVYRCVMSQSEVNKRRAVSQSGKSAASPWVLWAEEQGQKTVIKKLLSALPFSSEELGVNTQDEDADQIIEISANEVVKTTEEPQDITPAQEEEHKNKSVRDRLGIKAHEPKEESSPDNDGAP